MNTQRQVSAGSEHGCWFSPELRWLDTEHEPPLQLPQSAGQSPQLSLPLQLPSPHWGAGGGGLPLSQLPQAEHALPSPQQSP